jgi:hypothetical protein
VLPAGVPARLLFGPFVSTMLTPVELDDADKAALIALLTQTIAVDPFPMSQRNRTFKAIIAKLEPPPPRPQPYPNTEAISATEYDTREKVAAIKSRSTLRRAGNSVAPRSCCRRMDHETTVEKVAREMVDRYGPMAPTILRERAEVANQMCDELAAKAWRDIADKAERSFH